jgi:ATP-dependent exoDNAse (exonuclease V) beta subunit
LPNLTIYRASAGAGKTWTLTRDYIDLLVELPANHEHILAVTFTNKATEEMKSRILSELHKIILGKDSDMLDFFTDKYKLTELRARERAREILNKILHNYSRFHVETIDSFFQKVIRSFARELNLPAAYSIELDTGKVLSASIDRMLYRLGEKEQLLHWLVTYTRDRIAEGRGWKIKDSIRNLGYELFKETFQQYGSELTDMIGNKDLMRRYHAELEQIRNTYLDPFRDLGRQAIGIISGYGLQAEDFFNKNRGIANFFRSVAEGKKTEPTDAVYSCLHNIDKWIPGKSSKRDILEKAFGELDPILEKMIRMYEQEYPGYRTADTILKNIYMLGILTDLSENIYEYAAEQDIFLISDAARFLMEIMEGNEASFVYEKTGSYLDYYMIDEFQDTSDFQWLNMKPLIHDSLSMDHRSLVVGDIKQSIYRWRNSNWEILSEQISRSFDPSLMQMKYLDYNRRSQERIISFNNEFFSSARQLLAGLVIPGEEDAPGPHPYSEKVMSAYADVLQKIPPEREAGKGTVRVDLLNAAGREFYEAADSRIIELLGVLSDRGYRQKDIAFLVRKRKEGERIAGLLLRYNTSPLNKSGRVYQVISDESLYLDKSAAIRLIINALTWLADPGDNLNYAELIFNHKILTADEAKHDQYNDLFLSVNPAFGDQTTGEKTNDLKAVLDNLKHLPLNELIEEIIIRCGISGKTEHSAFLAAFQDLVLDYSRNGLNDVHSFLEWWKETGVNKSLNIPGDQEAIRIMTIHKAKGLQFRVVIVPYCDWKLDHERASVMWFRTDRPPYSTLPVVPVLYSSGLAQTFFRDQYFEERFRIHVDNLNLLYVAFTRAIDALFVITPEISGKTDNIRSVSDLISKVLSEDQLANNFRNDCTHDGRRWQSGDMNDAQPEPVPAARQFIRLHQSASYSGDGKLIMRSGNLDVFNREAGWKIDQGRVMHRIFQGIKSAGDVDAAVFQLISQGKAGIKDKDTLVSRIKVLISAPPVNEWFDGSWKVMNEQDILTPAGNVYRPDRIMLKEGRLIIVDYKFGAQKSDAYNNQVNIYRSLLQEMGYADIRAYLWYVTLKEVVQVEEA